MYNKRNMGYLEKEVERGDHSDSVREAIVELKRVAKTKDLKDLHSIQPVVESALKSFNKEKKKTDEDAGVEGNKKPELRDEAGWRSELLLSFFLNLELAIYKEKSDNYTKWVILLEKVKEHPNTPFSKLVDELELYISKQNETSDRKTQNLSLKEFNKLNREYNTTVKDYLRNNMDLIDQLRAESRLEQRISHLRKKVSEEDKIPFGEWLKQERANLGLSLADLADKTGYSASYISRIERGVRTNPTPNTISKIVKSLGFESDSYLSLLTNEDEDLKEVDLYTLIKLSQFTINEKIASNKKKHLLSEIIELINEDDVLRAPKINELQNKIRAFQETE